MVTSLGMETWLTSLGMETWLTSLGMETWCEAEYAPPLLPLLLLGRPQSTPQPVPKHSRCLQDCSSVQKECPLDGPDQGQCSLLHGLWTRPSPLTPGVANLCRVSRYGVPRLRREGMDGQRRPILREVSAALWSVYAITVALDVSPAVKGQGSGDRGQ